MDYRVTPRVAVGIDVGGRSKGFHGVALRGREVVATSRFDSAESAVMWSFTTEAAAVGIDSPCRWSRSGRSRCAERELMNEGIFCFSTPEESTARTHPKRYFEWMLQGARLYELLAGSHRLLGKDRTEPPVVLETFPHAVVCSLAGRVVRAKPKSRVRRRTLSEAGIYGLELRNIDYVDAALCAVAANAVLDGEFRRYGDEGEGFIVVPADRRS